MLTVCSFAQDTVDVVHFKSGNSIKGKIIELSDDTVKIETGKDNVFFFRMDTILKIKKKLINKPYDPKFFISLSGGYTMPAYETDFWKTYDPGFCFNIGCGYNFSKLLTMRLDLQHNMFPYHIKKLIFGNRTFYYESSDMSFTAGNLVLLINSPFKSTFNIYGIIGSGIYFLTKGSLANPEDKFKKIYNFGFNTGGGVSIKLLKNSIYLFAEAQYNHVIGPEAEKGYIPIKLGFFFIPFLN